MSSVSSPPAVVSAETESKCFACIRVMSTADTIRASKQVVCATCPETTTEAACVECHRRYVLSVMQDPHCMFCKKPWTREQQVNYLGLSFVSSKLRAHKEIILEAQQRCTFPTTMPLIEQRGRVVEVEIMAEKAREKVRAAIDAENRTLRQLRRERQRFDRMYIQILRHGRLDDNQQGHPRADAHRDGANESKSEATPHAYLRPCSHTECPGFIHEKTGHCPACRSWTCLKCNVALSQDPSDDSFVHECTSDDLATWEELRKTTRPCPGCGTRIFKISGCQQMWCSQCHTSFDWATGKREEGVIHNPHYYDWLFSDNRLAPVRAAVHLHHPCANDANDENHFHAPSSFSLLQRLRLSQANHDLEPAEMDRLRRRITATHLKLVHNQQSTLPWLRQNYGDRHRPDRYGEGGQLMPWYAHNPTAHRYLDMRVRYLSGDMDVNDYRRQLQREQKKHDKTREMLQVMETYAMLMASVFREFIEVTPPSKDDFHRVLDRIDRVKSWTKDAMQALNRCYQSNLRIEME